MSLSKVPSLQNKELIFKTELSFWFYLYIFFCVDYSKFGDIFDEDFFIYALSKNVNVVKELPKDILERYNYNISSIVNLRLKAWSSPTYYLHKVLPQLLRLGYASH